METEKNYKDTLNLPITSFAMKANLAQREPEMLKKWQADGLYEAIRSQSAQKPRYMLQGMNGEILVSDANAENKGAVYALKGTERKKLIDKLDRDRRGTRVVAGARRRVDRHGEELEADNPTVGLPQTGVCDLQRAHLADRSADDPGERCIAAAEICPEHASLLVGVRT